MSTEFINDQWRLPNAWNGTESNVNKQSNYSMDFDSASSDYIDSNLNISSYSEFSVSLWLKRSNSIAYVVGQWVDGTSSNQSYVIQLYNNNVYFNIRNSSLLANSAISTTSLNNTDWYHIGATWDGSNIKIYINGTLEDTTSCTTMNNPSSTIVTRIGGASGGSLTPFNGSIDGVAIFNYALSSSQITTLYGSSSTGIGNPITLNPVAYYPLGDQDAFNGANYLVPNSSLKDYVFDFYNETISSNNFIDINSLNSNILNSSFSIGIWIKKEEKPSFTDNDRIIDLTVDSNTSLQIICDNSSGKFAVNFILSGVSKINQQAFNSFTASANVWNQIVLTWDGSSYVYYFNGQPVTSTSTILVGVGGTGFFLGKRADANNTTFFNGEMSNVQIFNSALPATGSNSVETLYNNGSPLTSMSGFTSLQGWWKLDASATYDSSTNTWTIPDDSTNSNDGTSSGMTQANLVQSDLSFTSGYSPYALNFDSASSDYIDCGNDSSLQITSDLSISAWFKIDNSSPNSYFNIITKWISGNAAWSSYVAKSTGILSFWISTNGSTQIQINSNTNVNDGNWHHFTGINDGTNIKLYIDGNLEDTGTGGTIYNSTQNVLIGKTNQNSFLFSGSISNISIWNTDLTSSQVSEIYNEGVPSNLNNHSAYSNLVSWWQLGSNSSFNTNWTVLDEKGSNNGTSSNMGEDAIVDGVGSYANGLSSGMGGDEVIGSAPFSDANSLSVNMDVEDRVTDTPS